MTGPFHVFPDVQRLVVDVLAVLVPGIEHTGIETPTDLESRMPFIRVLRGDGSREQVNEIVTLDIDVFASTYTQAEALSQKVAAFLCGPPPPVAALDRIDCDNTPQEFPWGDDATETAVRRFGSSFTVVSRRRRWLT